MRLDVTAPVGACLSAIMDGLLERTEARLLSRKGDVHEAVHDARKDLKAFRSYLRLLKPIIGDTYGELNTCARDAARILSEARDTQALSDSVTLLEKYATGRNCGFDVAPLRHAITTETRKSATAKAIRAASGDVADQLAPARSVVQAWQLPDEPEPYIAGLAATYKTAQRHLRRALANRQPDALHEARKRVIHWRYQLELFAGLWPRVLKAEVRELQDLREDLGQHNDLVLLEARIRDAQGGFAKVGDTSPFLDAITVLRATRVRAARYRYALLFSRPPGALKQQVAAWWHAARERKSKP